MKVDGVGRETSGRGGGGGGLTPGGTFGGRGRDPKGGACLVMVLEAAIASFSRPLLAILILGVSTM